MRLRVLAYGWVMIGWLAHGTVASNCAHAQVGAVVEDRELPAWGGGRHHLLTQTVANVIVFIRPGQEHSNAVLQQLVRLEKETAGKPMRWVAVVSDHASPAEVEALVKDNGLTMPVLMDVGDAVYGELGVVLTPVTVIVDRDRKIAAYQSFTKINYVDGIRAHIQYLLGEIDARELARALKPPAALTPGDEASVAQRRLKLAEKLFQAGNTGKALESAVISVEKDPTVAAAHAWLGRILAAQGNCDEALEWFEQALELDPSNGMAREGKQACERQETTP